MTDEAPRPRPAAQHGRSATQHGPTSATVAANVRRVRNGRGLSTYDLARKLSSAHHTIAPAAISRIERRERQVTVDDLMALATVLDVPPAALLLPPDDHPYHTIEITGAGEVPADVAWQWADNQRPLTLPDGDTSAALLTFRLLGLPPRRRTLPDLTHRA